METRRAYFTRRAQEERAKAAAAASEKARRAHLELAFRYEKTAEGRYDGGAASAAPTPSIVRQTDAAASGSELGQLLVRAFPLPTSGAFPDLLHALANAD